MSKVYDLLPQQDQMFAAKRVESAKSRTCKRLLWTLAFIVFVAVAGPYTLRGVSNRVESFDHVAVSMDARLPYRSEKEIRAMARKMVKTNSTLGFERIYVLSMPNRRDKRAEQVLLADHYGYDIEFVDGYNLAQERPELNNEKLGELGCAEGHAAVWAKMLKDKVTTALIFEDDFDFSRNLRAQLELFQEPLATHLSLFTGNKTRVTQADPYNSAHWDTLWLGHCGDRAWNTTELPSHITQLPYLTYADPTRPQIDGELVAKMYDAYGIPQDVSQGIRVIQPNRDTWCLSGYAMTAPGARKSLYKNAHKGEHAGHIDWDVMMLAREKRLRTFSLSPPLFAHRRPLHGEDSDRAHKHVTTLPGREGITSHIGEDSARKHLFNDMMSGTHPLIWEDKKH